MFNNEIFVLALKSILFFALLYYVTSKVGIAEFHKKNNEDEELTLMQSLYLSFATQSTVGYGDVSAKNNVAMTFVCCQMLLTIYVVSLVKVQKN